AHTHKHRNVQRARHPSIGCSCLGHPLTRSSTGASPQGSIGDAEDSAGPPPRGVRPRLPPGRARRARPHLPLRLRRRRLRHRRRYVRARSSAPPPLNAGHICSFRACSAHTLKQPFDLFISSLFSFCYN
uniref:Uncharacterized protein n=1 Tax=Aegilops tauschii subsp. strangulata TaxID=200361 RepID=A0A453EIC9_AEGTS